MSGPENRPVRKLGRSAEKNWGKQNYNQLVGGLEHEFYDFPYIGNVIIPTDELIFFRGVGIPPTSEGLQH